MVGGKKVLQIQKLTKCDAKIVNFDDLFPRKIQHINNRFPVAPDAPISCKKIRKTNEYLRKHLGIVNRSTE